MKYFGFHSQTIFQSLLIPFQNSFVHSLFLFRLILKNDYSLANFYLARFTTNKNLSRVLRFQSDSIRYLILFINQTTTFIIFFYQGLMNYCQLNEWLNTFILLTLLLFVIFLKGKYRYFMVFGYQFWHQLFNSIVINIQFASFNQIHWQWVHFQPLHFIFQILIVGFQDLIPHHLSFVCLKILVKIQ